MTASTETSPNRRLSDWLSLVALVICWGSSFAITKVAIETISPLWTVSLRVVAALFIFTPIFFATGQRLPRDRGFWLWMVWLSLLGTTLPFFLIAWGTQHIDTGMGGVLIGAVPLFTIGLAHFLVPGEKATPAKVVGFSIGFAGLLVLVGQSASFEFSGQSLAMLGQFAVLGAALCYASQGISAKIMPPASAMQKTMAAMLIAFIPATAASFASGMDGVVHASAPSLIAVLGLGLLSTALPGVIMFRLIAQTGPSFVSMTSYLIPVYTLVLGVVIFSERPGPNTLIGLALILGGIAITEFWAGVQKARR